MIIESIFNQLIKKFARGNELQQRIRENQKGIGYEC